jgi:hypothetical protein
MNRTILASIAVFVLITTVSSSQADSTPTPTLVQHVNTGANTVAQYSIGNASHPGNPFNVQFPNPVGAGNCLILCIANPYSSRRTITITDGRNTWPTMPAQTINNGTTMLSAYVLPNAAAGTQNLTITFDAALAGCHFGLAEFYNLAASSVVEATSGAVTTGTASIAPGSLSTVTDQDLIFHYGYDASNVLGNTTAMTNMTPASGFTPSSLDIMLGTFAEYQVQSAHGTINPTLTLSGATDSFLNIALALKPAANGTAPPAGIRIVGVYSWLQNRDGISPIFPCVGNLLYVASAFGSGDTETVTLSSSGGLSWNQTPQARGENSHWPPQCFYAQNVVPSLSLRLMPVSTFNGPFAKHPQTFMAYDVVNAATPVAYDSYAAGSIGGETWPGNFSLGTITPSTANGLIFATLGTLEGSIHGSVGQFFDAPYYGGEEDWDNMANNDGYSHYYNPNLSSVTFGWTLQASGGTPGINVAVTAFKGANSTSSPTATPTPSPTATPTPSPTATPTPSPTATPTPSPTATPTPSPTATPIATPIPSPTATPMASTPKFVQSGYSTPSSQSIVTVRYAGSQAAGGLNVVVVGWGDTTTIVNSVTDSVGNAYTLAVGPTKYSKTLSQSIYYAKNILGASAGNVVSVKFSRTTPYPDVRILQYSGLDTANPLDVTTSAIGTGSICDSGLLNTTGPARMLVAANMVTDHTSTAGVGFTMRAITNPDGNGAEDRIVTSTGSYSATAGLNQRCDWVMQMVAFRAADSP